MKSPMVAAFGGLLLSACAPLAWQLERDGNPVAASPPYAVDAEAQTVHNTLLVADLHADTLLSSRDLRAHGTIGHADIPRLLLGKTLVQVFSAPSNMPTCPTLDNCTEGLNEIALLAVISGWSPATWFSDRQRVLDQARRLHALAAGDPRLAILRTRQDLTALLADRQGRLGGLLAVEGAQAVGDTPDGVDALFAAGFRMLGLTHFLDNRVAGSAHGVRKYGISPFGDQVLARARAHGMIIDLAHASPQTIMDFLARPDHGAFVISHTGVRAVCPTVRNLSDAQIGAIVAAGGLIGLGIWDEALCLQDRSPQMVHLDRMVAAIAQVVAISRAIHPERPYDHVALGSDFDGWVRTGFDASGWPLLTQALLRAGYSRDAIAAIMGGNVCRFLLRALPDHGEPPDLRRCLS